MNFSSITSGIPNAATKVKKTMQNSFCNVRHRFDVKNFVEETNDLLKLVEDEKIKQYVQNELKNISPYNPLSIRKIKNLKELVDCVNSFNGHYSVLNNGFRSSYLSRLGKFATKDEFVANKMERHILEENIRIEEKCFSMKEFIKRNPSNEMSDYIYEKYYLKFVEEELEKEKNIDKTIATACDKEEPSEESYTKIVEKLRNISQQCKTKVFLDADSMHFNNPKDVLKQLEYVENELLDWQTTSNGKAKMPAVLDFITAKESYYNSASAYGKSCAAGFSEYSGSISINSLDQAYRYPTTLRHEMTHSNESKIMDFINTYLDMTDDIVKLIVGSSSKLTDKLALHSMFTNAGISSSHARYGYNNHKEYIAVASEGDTSSYPKWFKYILMAKGMPKEVFSLKPLPKRSIVEQLGVNACAVTGSIEITGPTVNVNIFG